MTRRIYYTDPSCRAFTATVLRSTTVDGRPAVVLDQTAFYPTSGGQPFDTGLVGSARVVDVVDDGDDVVHVVDTPLDEGARVSATIDWERRFDHMQQHTGQHVLSAAFVRVADNPTVSFHMGVDAATIDLERELPPADVERAVDEANRVVWEDRAVAIRFVSAAEAATLPLRKEPARQGQLRLIEIHDFDLSACGGTHVARTGAIGIVAVLGTERYRGGMRVTFACGGRALRALRTYRDAIAGSVRALSVLPHELPAAIERAQADTRDLRKAMTRLQTELAGHEAQRLLREAATTSAGVRLVCAVLDGWDAAGLKAIATSAIAQSRVAVALFTSTVPAAVVIARAADVEMDAAAALRTLTSQFGGRGGGRQELAQAGGLAGDVAVMADVARRLVDGST